MMKNEGRIERKSLKEKNKEEKKNNNNPTRKTETAYIYSLDSCPRYGVTCRYGVEFGQENYGEARNCGEIS